MRGEHVVGVHGGGGRRFGGYVVVVVHGLHRILDAVVVFMACCTTVSK